MTVPHSDSRPDLQIVRQEAPSLGGSPSTGAPAGDASVPVQAMGLLEHAHRVADSTVAEARAEAERLLSAARERAAQVQRDARDLGQRLREEAERESADLRHRAFGEAERIVADAKTQVGHLESSLGGLQSSRDEALRTVRELAERLNRLLYDEHQDSQPHS